jgi:hypothetical protein
MKGKQLMPTDELENELRSTLARAAADFNDPGQARQRLLQRDYRPRRGNRRLAAGLTAAASAAALVLGLGLSGAFGSASPQPGHGRTPVQLAAFSVVSNPNGTVTLTLRPNMPLDPGAIQHALAQHGIPALVRTGSYCYSQPAPANNGAVHTYPKLRGYPPGQIPPTTRLVINRSDLAPGTEIGFGFLQHNRMFVQNILYDHTHTCTTSPPGN